MEKRTKAKNKDYIWKYDFCNTRSSNVYMVLFFTVWVILIHK